MSTTTKTAFSWANMPDDQSVEKMPSIELLECIDDLQRQDPLPPPADAIEWVMSLVPGLDKDAATQKLLGIAYPARNQYIQTLRDIAEAKFQEEPIKAENIAAYRKLDGRDTRLHLSISLGLRSEEEVQWVRECQRASSNSVVAIDTYHFKNYARSANLQRQFAARLAEWQTMLDEMEGRLLPLDADKVRARLEEEINKPFNPSDTEIESTRSQMGSWDMPASPQSARSLLEKEHKGYLSDLAAWRQHLNEDTATENKPTPRTTRSPR